MPPTDRRVNITNDGAGHVFRFTRPGNGSINFRIEGPAGGVRYATTLTTYEAIQISDFLRDVAGMHRPFVYGANAYCYSCSEGKSSTDWMLWPCTDSIQEALYER